MAKSKKHAVKVEEEAYVPIGKKVRDVLISNPTKSVDDLLPLLRKKFPDSKQVCNRASWMRTLRLELVKAGKVKAVKTVEPAVPVKSKKTPVKKTPAKKSPVKKSVVHSVLNRPVQ